jgi:tetratricopeptide (TPR) repeat protein
MPAKHFDIVEALYADLSPLIDGIDPHLLAGFLRDADGLASTVLRGFRVTPQTVRNPVVKQRLIKEAHKDRMLLDTLGVFWVDSNRELWGMVGLSSVKELKSSFDDLSLRYGAPALRIALLLDDRQTVNRLAEKLIDQPDASKAYQLALLAEEMLKDEEAAPPEEPTPAPPAEDRSEIRRLRDKIHSLEAKIRELERQVEGRRHEVEHGKSELKAMKHQIGERQKQLEKAEKAADRFRRAKDSAEEEKSHLQHELKQARKEIESLKAVPAQEQAPPPEPPGPDWAPIVSAMLKKGEYSAAGAFCETLKEMAPENLHARLVLEHVYARTDARDRQIEEALWIADTLSKRGQHARSCAFACRALEADPGSHDAQVRLRKVLEKLNPADEPSAASIRSLFGRMKVSHRPAYREAHKVIKQLGKAYLRALEGQPDALHPDKVFELSDEKRTMPMSIRRIVQAVDANDTAAVTFVRSGLANLKASHAALYQSIMESLEVHDGSCVIAVVRDTEPVVVDGSNVAWHETGDKPRLQNILELRKELRSEGYFPVYVYVDAALPYQVGQQSALKQLIEDGVVIASDAGTDADEAIVRQAHELSCPIVTNDRMEDWDPFGEIPKIRFAIDRFGITLYDR